MALIWLMARNIKAITAFLTLPFMTSIKDGLSFCGKPASMSSFLRPSLPFGEAKIEAAIAERLGADYWISFSCKDGLHINEGDLIRDCAAAFRSGYPRLRALGVNCTKPEYL